MNKRRKAIIVAAATVFVLSLVFPPFFMNDFHGQLVRYALFSRPPRLPYAPGVVGTFGEKTWPAFIDTATIHWEWFVIALLSAVAFVCLSDGSSDPRSTGRSAAATGQTDAAVSRPA